MTFYFQLPATTPIAEAIWMERVGLVSRNDKGLLTAPWNSTTVKAGSWLLTPAGKAAAVEDE
jgi:hypothetical protein